MHTSSFLLSNLHCPSCISNIEDALFALRPKPLSVSPSIVSSWVTVRHDLSLPVATIRTALEDAGFEVRSVLADNSPRDILEEDKTTSIRDFPLQNGISDDAINEQWMGSRPTPSNKQYMRMKERHLEVCALCRSEELRNAGEKQPSSSASQSNPQTQHRQVPRSSTEYNVKANTTPNAGNVEKEESAFVVVDKGETTDLWRASLAIGGMTCVSCVNAIKEELEGKEWVKKVNVNLIMNSATIEFNGKDHATDLVEEIESIGYEAVLDSVTLLRDAQGLKSAIKPINSKDEESLGSRRIVDIQVAGMFCERCPERILRSLATFADRGLHVEKSLTIKDPILKISYTPHPPEFTIRHVIAALSEIDSTLVSSIYHPPTLEDRSRILHAQERKSILRRVALCVIIAIPTFIIGILLMSLVPASNIGRQFFESPLWSGISRAQWALFIMATPVYFLAADVFHLRMLREIRSMWRRGSKIPLLQRFYRFGSMDMLISLGTSIAYFSSVAQLINIGVHQTMMNTVSSFYFDSVVFLTMFLLIGRLIEAFSKSRTGDAVAMLGKLRPTKAILVDNTVRTRYEIDADLLEYGDEVQIPHGASPPNDGFVMSGSTTFDESSLTGESKLVKKIVGDQVFSGTVNKGSPVNIRITGVSGTSMIDQIIEVVREGQTRHAPIERLADTLTSYFVPFITLVAVCTWLVWLGLGLSGSLPESYLDAGSGGWAAWSLQFAIAVFVVACPCGLGLAAPTALFVGGGLAAQHGILVKGGGEAFEKASRLDCIVFDKTGTLTVGGEPIVTDCFFLPHGTDGISPQEETRILSLVKILEESSNHPIAKAIVSFCPNRALETLSEQGLAEIPGKGMKGVINDNISKEPTEIIVGNEALMKDHDVEFSSDLPATLRSLKGQGKSIALVAIKPSSLTDLWRMVAIFGISDEIRPEAASMIQALQKRGTAVWMLSGDNYESACAIGAQVGIPSDNIIAGVLPSQKADKIKYLQKSLKPRDNQGKELSQRRTIVAMVGDGINDSPALTAADIGIAIGSGSDIAISSAEFVLISSNLNALITLLNLSNMVFKRIKFNFGWALVYNLVGVPVAAGVLYPLVSNGSHVRLDPVWASLAMALSSISVVCSSLALRSGIPGIGFRTRKRLT